jgi:hypothetical protein
MDARFYLCQFWAQTDIGSNVAGCAVGFFRIHGALVNWLTVTRGGEQLLLWGDAQ